MNYLFNKKTFIEILFDIQNTRFKKNMHNSDSPISIYLDQEFLVKIFYGFFCYFT